MTTRRKANQLDPRSPRGQATAVPRHDPASCGCRNCRRLRKKIQEGKGTGRG